MAFHIPPFLACPLDGLVLQCDGKSVSCANGHAFDFDRKGALNLLPVQFRQSREPGDSKMMVEARGRFLDSGAYQPIAVQLCDLVASLAPHGAAILDAGCGEGYYTAALKTARPDDVLAGLDISKDAIQAAARRRRDIQWIVGTNKRLPVLDHSLDVIVCLFGFPVWDEFRRALKPGGHVILADPGPLHLIEMRRVLYPQLRDKPPAEKQAPGFSFVATHRLYQEIVPPAPERLADQIAMTPHQFRTTPEQRHAAIHARYEAMTIEVEFSVYSC